MAPINLPDGTEVSEVILPDGASASEVIAPDGRTVFGGIPDKGLVHDYDTTKISGTGGDSISTVTDQAGSDDLKQTDSTKQPELKTGSNGINGNQVLQFDGGDELMEAGYSSDIEQPITIYAVYRSNDGTQSDAWLYDSTDTYAVGMRYGKDSNVSIWAGDYLEGNATDTDNHIHGAIYDGSNSEIREDGATAGTGDGGALDLTNLTLGTNNDGESFYVDVGRILIWDRKLSSSEITDVESTLSTQWGISV